MELLARASFVMKIRNFAPEVSVCVYLDPCSPGLFPAFQCCDASGLPCSSKAAKCIASLIFQMQDAELPWEQQTGDGSRVARDPDAEAGFTLEVTAPDGGDRVYCRATDRAGVPSSAYDIRAALRERASTTGLLSKVSSQFSQYFSLGASITAETVWCFISVWIFNSKRFSSPPERSK